MMIKSIKNRKLINISLITLLGAVLRFSGIRWGITSIFHPDEDMPILVNHMIENRSLLHEFWTYPCQCSSKLMTCVIVLIRKFISLRFIDYFFICRGYVAMLSTLTIVLTYLICKKIRNERFGLMAAAIVAVYPVYVQYSKQVVLDTICLFWGLLVVYISLSYLDENKWYKLLGMSFFAACATTEKWSAGCICVYIAIVVISSHWKQWMEIVKQGLLSICFYFVSVVVFIPNGIFRLSDIFDEISELSELDYLGITTITDYIGPFFMCGGVITLILFTVGCVSVLKDHNRYHIAYIYGVAWLISLWLVTGWAPVRWGISIYWMMLVLIAEGVQACLIDRPEGIIKRLGGYATGLVLITFLVESIWFVTVATHSDQDTRIVSEVAFKEKGINIDNTLSDAYTTLRPGKLRDEGTSKLWSGEDEIIYKEENSVYITEPDINYIVTGQYGRNKDSEANKVLRENGAEIYRIDSDMSYADIFQCGGHGAWNKLEPDVIKESVLDIMKIVKGANVGPSMVVYDVSGFIHVNSSVDQ